MLELEVEVELEVEAAELEVEAAELEVADVVELEASLKGLVVQERWWKSALKEVESWLSS